MVAPRIGLARARKAAAYTQEGLAEALHVAVATVSNWERGRTEPVPYKRPKLAKLLGITLTDLERLLRNDAPSAHPDSERQRLDPQEATSPAPLQLIAAKRRGESTETVTLPGGSVVPAATARTEPALVESLLVTLQQYAVTDNLTGSHSLLPIAAQQMVFIERLLNGSRGRTHDLLLLVSARFAEFTGWLHQDSGHLRAAMQWSNTALDFAEESGDPRLVSYIRMRKSNIASDARNPDLVIRFARAALHNSGSLTPRLRAVALRQEAHGHALAGDHKACARALDNAVQYASDAPDDETDIARYCTPNFVEMEAAHCWVELGKPAKALAILQQGLAGWHPDFRRDLGLCLARLSAAHAGVGQSDEAVIVAQHALAIASETRSHRTASQLYRASELMTRAGASDQAQHLRHVVELALR